MAADAATALELSNVAFAQGDPTATLSAALLKHEESLDGQPQYPMDGLDGNGGNDGDDGNDDGNDDDPAVTGQHTHGHCHDADHSHLALAKEKKYKKRTDLIKDGPERSTVHSSKNEGQHTDKRYLCYICNKLFTRRRSVRDHINKIHSVKTWEPQRSLEITVDPTTGEPIEPLEDTIARWPLPPTPEQRAGGKDKAAAVADTIEGGGQGRVPTPTPKAEARTDADSAMVAAADASPVGKPEPHGDTDELRAESPLSGLLAPPRPAAGKKRPAPDAVRALPAAATKKGIARPHHRSTPPSKKANNEDGEIFCICRKGDNHTWMIACDGGCDEWYHGNCVNIRERDGDLIDKYICPRCTKVGLQTTWKRMCRRKGCRKPARVLMDPPSKYCSKECGRIFFVELIRRGDPHVETAKNDQAVVEGRKAKKSADEGSEYETDSSADEDELPNRGGPLRAGEVRAILDACASIDQWRRLGRKPDTPPREPGDPTGGANTQQHIEYDDFEKAKLEQMAHQRKALQERLEVLEAREKWMDLIKTRSASIVESVKKEDKKAKDPCGFDPRFAWSEDAFLKWYGEQGGKARLTADKVEVGAPEDDEALLINGVHGEQDAYMDDGDGDGDGEAKFIKRGGVCVRNRCPRHKSWAKAQLAEIRFEQDVVRRGLRRCDSVERGVRERGVLRAWEKTK
ncbi:hypothetical protein DV737_g4650, partial [Chaetothyriales sp. CBS 132003]